MNPRPHTLTAILPCTDVPASRAFYARLGFHQTGGDDQYAMMGDGKGAELHLQPAVEGWLIPSTHPFGLYLYAENIDELAARFPGEILGKARPEDKPWGMYEFALSDPDQTLIPSPDWNGRGRASDETRWCRQVVPGER